jgi:hypothetical protein
MKMGIRDDEALHNRYKWNHNVCVSLQVYDVHADVDSTLRQAQLPSGRVLPA